MFLLRQHQAGAVYVASQVQTGSAELPGGKLVCQRSAVYNLIYQPHLTPAWANRYIICNT